MVRGLRLSGVMAAGALLGSAGYVAAAPLSASASGPYICSGSPTAPGTLAGGSYGSVEVSGFCAVNAGPVVVHGSLTVERRGALVAAFGLNDRTGHGSSRLTVWGNVTVDNGGSAILGCFPTSFPCIDDPNPSAPTLSSHDVLHGNLTSDDPLGVILHDVRVDGNVAEEGGGGGFNCNPQGVFVLFQSPVFSDYEDSSIGGWISINNLTSCWLGVARVHVNGNGTFVNNQLADPDGAELLSNDFDGNLACSGNSMMWDSVDITNNLYPRALERNQVAGTRSGQCTLASPRKPGGELGPGKF